MLPCVTRIVSNVKYAFYCNIRITSSIHTGCMCLGRGGAIWGNGGKSPPKDFKKRGKLKNMGYFHASKLTKLAFLSSLTRKYVIGKGFYHDFSTKKASASGGLPPGPRGSFAPPPPHDFALAPHLCLRGVCGNALKVISLWGYVSVQHHPHGGTFSLWRQHPRPHMQQERLIKNDLFGIPTL